MSRAIVKSLIKTGVLSAAAIALSGGVALFTADLAVTIEQDKNSVSGQAASVENEIQALKTKIGKVGTESRVFQSYQQKENLTGLVLDRSKVSDVLNELKPLHFMFDMDASVEPTQPAKEEKFKQTKAQGETTTISINFKALSDIEVLRFTHALGERLPGVLRITDFTLEKTESMVKEKKATTLEPLLTGKINYLWMGIQPEKAPGDKTAPTTPEHVNPAAGPGGKP